MSFTFDNLSRIGNDNIDLSQRNVQNLHSANYNLLNFFASDCTMARPIDFATSQPNVFYNGSHQVGIGGCNIDTNSKLTIGSENTYNKDKLSLNERPFKTVPYLGKGKVNPVLESQLMQGDNFTNRRSVNMLSEQSYMGLSNTPLLPCLEATLNNSANFVEGAAVEGWIRGGVPVRQLVRDVNQNQ